jgi:hypothetical protein
MITYSTIRNVVKPSEAVRLGGDLEMEDLDEKGLGGELMERLIQHEAGCSAQRHQGLRGRDQGRTERYGGRCRCPRPPSSRAAWRRSGRLGRVGPRSERGSNASGGPSGAPKNGSECAAFCFSEGINYEITADCRDLRHVDSALQRAIDTTISTSCNITKTPWFCGV